jgi:hypothetical protein
MPHRLCSKRHGTTSHQSGLKKSLQVCLMGLGLNVQLRVPPLQRASIQTGIAHQDGWSHEGGISNDKAGELVGARHPNVHSHNYRLSSTSQRPDTRARATYSTCARARRIWSSLDETHPTQDGSGCQHRNNNWASGFSFPSSQLSSYNGTK